MNNSKACQFIGQISKIICRTNGEVGISCKGRQLRFVFNNVHAGLRPTIPYILGERIYEGRDTLTIKGYPDEYLHEIANGGLVSVLERLLTFEFITLISGYELQNEYNSKGDFNREKSPYYKEVEGRDFYKGLGSNYCSNLLIPDMLDYKVSVKILEGERVKLFIGAVSDKTGNIAKYISSLLNVLIFPNDCSLVVEEPLHYLLEKMTNCRVNYIGIVHIGENRKLALAETWYQQEGSFGFATSGGFNPTPYQPKYGAAVESYGEFGLKITSIDKLVEIKHQNYSTIVCPYGAYSGDLNATEKEFQINSGGWYSIVDIKNKRLHLRKDCFVSMIDYINYLESTLYLNKIEMNKKYTEIFDEDLNRSFILLDEKFGVPI